MRSIKKRGAIELSMSTIVILVLAMSMLILGIFLINKILGGASGTVDLIDKNVKAQINQLFNTDDRRVVVYLPGNTAEVKKGKSYNVEFGIKNVVRGESQAGQFTYQTRSSEVGGSCRGLSLEQAERFIETGRASTQPIPITPGDRPTERTIMIEIPETAPLCTVTYDIIVKKDGQDYDTGYFILRIV